MNKREWRHGARITALCPACDRRLRRVFGAWWCDVHHFIHHAQPAPALAVQLAMFRDAEEPTC